MKTGWLALGTLLLVSNSAQAAFLQCTQSELVDASCNSVSVNTSPLHFTASCIQCKEGGSEPDCTDPTEKVTPQTLAMEQAKDNSSVSGTFTQVGTCAFGNLLWKFSGSLVNGTTYNVVVNVSGLPKTLLLSFTAGASTPSPDLGGVLPYDGGGTTTGDSGGTTTGDGGSSTTGDGGNGGGGSGSGDEGCSCRVGARPAASLLPAGLLLLVLLRLRRRGE